MTDILPTLRQIDVTRTITAQVESFAQNTADIDANFVDVRGAVNLLCDRIVALESQAAGSPVISNFMLSAPARVDAGTDLGGQLFNATYSLFASSLVTTARLVGFSTTPAGATTVLVPDALRNEGANTQEFTFPTGVDFSAEGNTYAVQLELFTQGQVPGTDTPTATARATIVAQAAPRTDLLYYGTVVDPTPGNVDVTLLESQTRLDGDITFPTGTVNAHIVLAYPDTAPPVTAMSVSGFNQLAGFTLTSSALTVDGVAYSTLISTNLLLPGAFSGITWTITR